QEQAQAQAFNFRTEKASFQAQPQQAFSTSSPQWATISPQDQQPFPQAGQQVPFSQVGQGWQAASNLLPQQSTPEPMPSHGYRNNAPYMTPAGVMGALSSTPGTGSRPQAPRTNNIGFVIAGLCVFAGGLILIFVYFMALGLPSSNSTNSAYTSTGITATPHTNANLPTAVTASPTVASSPTVSSNQGAQYIDNPQMASSVNISTAQPTQIATTFKPQQKIYVTFNIHPNGKFGAVCLYWYLNNKNITQYPFAVTPNDKAGYSYAIYGGTGPAYVEIYWASSTACSDKILAQHVNFKVTA
ncbi:MAG: hypothetical protein ACJ795_00770, partial [Ktedonobacteraceae bacterium]